MRIGVICWGSLYWDPRELAVEQAAWDPMGPKLPIEFSRISSDGRLTLVIDPKFPTASQTYWKISTNTSLDSAIENLMIREKTPHQVDIGYLLKESGRYQSRWTETLEVVKPWLTAQDLDAVIWTDLDARFQEVTGRAITRRSLETYLTGLDKPTFLRASEYITKTPVQTQTYYRDYLEELLLRIAPNFAV